ncbi:MAG: CotH kinase family protein [Prevotella sp.]|nr:CotH kinase family protein [Prevotella sp.]MCM1074798.1 CotH kinase family protein [Ruminococcus sp.]
MNFKHLIIVSIAIHSPISTFAELQINEVMQSNVHGIMDDLNDFPDSWVELYNNGDESVNLKDYGLSVKDKASKAYQLPDKELAPGEYVAIYCDKVGSDIHADFRVDSGKGDVFLWKGKEKIESVSLAKMPAPDISYGRLNESSDEWGYQAVATPGETNCGVLVADILPEPLFSEPGGVKSAALTLSLTMPKETPKDVVIRYTLDGSRPTAESEIYTEPIEITETVNVRAALFADGYITPLPTTHSYIFHPREQTLPIVSLTGDPAYFYGDKIGILTDGTYSEVQPNFRYEWRRPVNVEYFELNGTTPINQVIETRLKGHFSRTYPLKSMVLYANKRFVTKRLEYEFFHEQRPGVTDFKSVELRNAGQDFELSYMRDAVIQTATSAGTDLGYSAYTPVIFYLNGKYMGIMNLRERCNDDNIYTNYNGLEDVDVIENWEEVNTGTSNEFDKFQAFYSTPGHTFNEYEEYMHTSQYADLMVANTFFNNVETPNYNIVMWRQIGEGYKWNWILKDTDCSAGIWGMPVDFNYLEWQYNPEYSEQYKDNIGTGTDIFRNLMETPEFRETFIDHLCLSMGDYLHPDVICTIVDKYADAIDSEMVYHRELYPSYEKFSTSIEHLKSWISQRVPLMYDMTTEFFGLADPTPLQISAQNEDITLSVNGLKLATGRFDGMWHPGRKLTITAVRPDGMEAVGAWRVNLSFDGKEMEMVYPGNTLDMTFPYAKSMTIEPVVGTVALDAIATDGIECTTAEWFDLQGRSLGTTKPASGIYLKKVGTRVTKALIR